MTAVNRAKTKAEVHECITLPVIHYLSAKLNELSSCSMVALHYWANRCAHVRQVNCTVLLHSSVFYTAQHSHSININALHYICIIMLVLHFTHTLWLLKK